MTKERETLCGELPILRKSVIRHTPRYWPEFQFLRLTVSLINARSAFIHAGLNAIGTARWKTAPKRGARVLGAPHHIEIRPSILLAGNSRRSNVTKRHAKNKSSLDKSHAAHDSVLAL